MRYCKIMVILLIPLLLAGCYNKKELDNLAYVIAIGADKDEGQNLKITYQIAIPIKIAGEGNEIGTSTYTTYTVSAPSIYLANAKVNALTSKEVNLSHLNLVLYGEDLAKDDLSGHINSLVSNVAIRPRTSVAICKGTAENFLNNVTPVLETSPARYYVLALSSFNYTTESAGTDVLDFYTSAQSPYKDAVAVIATLKEIHETEQSTDSSGGGSNTTKEAEFRGLAAFSGSKMVGEISPEMTIGHLIATNSLSNGALYVPDVKESSKTASIQVRQNGGCKVKVLIEGDVPKVTINANIDAHLEAYSSNTDYLDKENAALLKKEVEEELERRLKEYLEKTVALGSDIAGIGRYAKVNYLTYEEFEKINWKEIYPNATFDVHVDVELSISKIIFHKLPNQ
ncbi:MAG: Ger(x)C family spore germination protein [Clostridia bacterium]|nr:Ger(x)C family spore germination protein [Clostridia bacterium]